MLDRYYIGEHTRQSPEADVPLIEQSSIDDRLGGAGNVARNLLSLGLNPILISIIGEDKEGAILKKLCETTFREYHLFPIKDRPTTLKSRIVDEAFNQFLRLDREVIDNITASDEDIIMSQIDSIISSKDLEAIVIQDYNKGLLTPKVIKHIQELGAEKGVPIAVDPKKLHFLLLSDCTIFKPNLKELSQAAGYTILPNFDAITMAIKQLGLNGAQYIFVTLAENGIFYQNHLTGESGVVGGEVIPNPDVSGAGDTVLSTLVKALCEGLTTKKMATIANQAGATVCRKKGIDVIKIEELTL